jgi:hypothetical protein
MHRTKRLDTAPGRRRDCLDHVIVFCEAHLRPNLKAYASYIPGQGCARFPAYAACVANC